jgi:hypothetical protein
VAQLVYLGDLTVTPTLIVSLCLHFSLALYAGWRLPKVAREYLDKVLERLKRSKRHALLLTEKTPAIDTIIEEVQSTRQGRFSYLWEQPAIRAALVSTHRARPWCPASIPGSSANARRKSTMSKRTRIRCGSGALELARRAAWVATANRRGW